MKLLKTLQNNWKKSVFLFGVSVVGARYGYNRYYEHILLKCYCQKLQHYSLQTIRTERAVKTIVVFLNPSAGNGKAGKTFKKFVIPLLNFTGINFIVVPTAYEGHVSSLLKYLPAETEALVVAGGDGMLQDTVTGIMRHANLAHLPLGFIPIGTNNTFCSRYLGPDISALQLDKIYQSVVNITEGNVQKLSVLKIQPEQGQPIYTMSYFTWGAIKESIDMIPKFWWFGGLRTLAAMLRFSIKSDWPQTISCTINTLPCEFSNVTVLPGIDRLHTHFWPALTDRLGFLSNVALPINEHRHSGLLQKLTLVNSPSNDYSDEISIVPHTETKFCVDGEPVEARVVKITNVPDSLSMFVPEKSIPTETVSVIPQVPHSVKRLLSKISAFFGYFAAKP